MRTLLTTTSPASKLGSSSALWRALLSRRGLIFLGVLTIAAAGALNWGWLIALGLAPFILGALPCATMCALGLCMKGSGGSCENKAAVTPPRDLAKPS